MKLIQKISKKQKQVSILYLCSILGILFGVLASIVNTRFLSPNSYGDVRFVQNFANAGAVILYMGYFISGGRLLALWKDESDKMNLRGTMLLVLCRSALLLYLFMIVCSIIYSNKPNLSVLFLLALPLCLYLLFNNYLFNVSQGENRVGILSALELCPYALYVPVSFVTYYYYGATARKMMMLQGSIYLIVTIFLTLLIGFSFNKIKLCYKELKKENLVYGNQVYLGSLVMTVSTYLAGIGIGLFGENNIEVGFFSLAVTVSNPMAVLPSVIGITFFKDFTSLQVIPNKVLKGSILLTVTSCVAFISIIKPLVIFLYSKDYAIVGEYAILLSIGFSTHGLGDLFGKFLLSHGQGKLVRNSSVLCGLVKLIGYVIMVYFWGVYGAIFTTIMADFVYSGNMIIGYIHHVKKNSMISQRL